MPKALIARVRGLLLKPKDELPRTIAEPGDLKSLLPYVVALVSIGAVARFLSAGVIGTWVAPQIVFGMKIGGGWFRAPIRALFAAIFSVGIGVAAWWFFAFILNLLAPSFGARRDERAAHKAAAWIATPVWLAGAFGVLESVPYLGFVDTLAHIAALVYAVLLGIWALPLLLGTPEGKAPGHVFAAAGITIAALIGVWFLLFSLLLASLFGGSGVALLH